MDSIEIYTETANKINICVSLNDFENYGLWSYLDF